MRREHLPLMVLAGLTLLAGLWAGLNRLGWGLPPLRPTAHGPLMISGFLGALISLERAAAFGRRWPYAAPALALAGVVLLLAGAPAPVYQSLILLGSLFLLTAFLVTYHRHYGFKLEWAAATMSLGALCWVAGNLAWLVGRPLFQVSPWWIGFLMLTIAGERLELARVLLLRRASLIMFALSVAVFFGGLLVSLSFFARGLQLSGFGLVMLGLWLLRFDVAQKTVRQSGLTRFIAACLLPGYAWLVAAGALWVAWPAYFVAGSAYDAMLHMILVGFVFSMIFGHAPIIVPAILNLPITYRPAFYLHLILLHASLVLRVSGDIAALPALRLWGGLLNVTAILLFIGNTILATRKQTSGARSAKTSEV
ncbi:MAG: hypothetical protein HYZ49_13360 [Chloroflexi bacterium]|nr:hypothetical protein [Chloroflexota bacterium]